MWEIEAREEIRRTLAAYNFGGDRGALHELAECFTDDGVLELDSGEHARGRAAIVALLEGVGPNASRGGDVGSDTDASPVHVHHHVTNVHFRSLTPDEADVSSYFLVLTPVGVDHWGRYRDRLVRLLDGRWRFAHRVATADGFASDSHFLPPAGV